MSLIYVESKHRVRASDEKQGGCEAEVVVMVIEAGRDMSDVVLLQIILNAGRLSGMPFRDVFELLWLVPQTCTRCSTERQSFKQARWKCLFKEFTV